jgi:hypothetical protein
MADKASTTNATPPVGTPPEGGRWSWDGRQWVRLPELEGAPTAAAPAPSTASKE